MLERSDACACMYCMHAAESAKLIKFLNCRSSRENQLPRPLDGKDCLPTRYKMSLLHYVVKHPNTQVAVSLKQLAADVQSSSGRKAELLCDFSTVVRWVLSSHDREQIQNGKLSPYSTLYGGDFNSYGSCMLKFVESLEQLGIRPVFFLSGPPGSKKEEFQLNFEQYKEDTLRMQETCASMEQVCAGSKDVLQMNWSLTEAISIQVQCVLKTAGVCVVSCQGQPLIEVGHYLISNHQVIGVVSNNVELAVFVQGLNIFPPDLLSLNYATPTASLTAEQCNAVSSTSLADAMGLRETQLLDVVVLSRCDEEVLSELELGQCNLEALIQWLGDQNQPLNDEGHPKYSAMKLEIKKCFLLPPPYHEISIPGPRLDSLASCDLSTDKKTEDPVVSHSLAEIVTAKVQVGTMMPQLLSIVQGCYWRNSAVELASLGQPCINDITLALRKSLYSLMGLESVTEYGRTATKSFDTIHVELKHRVECGASFLKSVEERPLSERLSLLFDLAANQQLYRDSENLQRCVSAACQVGSEMAEPISGAALVACSALLLLFKSNEVASSFPQVRYFELDALLITCLTCVAEFPPHVLLLRPPTQAVRIGMYFSHILEQVYVVASYLGLLSELPAPANLFYSMAYIPYHVASLSEDAKVTPSHIDGPSLAKIREQFSSLQNLEPVLALQAEIINTSRKPNLPSLLHLFASSVDAVTAHKEKMNAEERNLTSLPVESGGGFNLRIDKMDDAYLSSSVNSDSSVFAKCNELSSAQDYQASEEDLYFVSMLGDVGNSEENDDVIDDDVMADDIGNADDEIFPIVDVEQFSVVSSFDEAKKLDARDRHSADVNVALSTKENIKSKVAEESHQQPVSNRSEPEVLDESTTEPVTLDKTQPPVETSVASVSPPSHPLPSTSPFYPPSEDNPARVHPPSEEHELPVLVHREKILHLVHNHRVVCIEGETGCGKSTKIPQFILDDSLNSNPTVPCRILVTQPRRVAVVKLAERVAAERNERIGQTVGYCIGGERHRTSETTLTYCTVGYLLNVSVYTRTTYAHNYEYSILLNACGLKSYRTIVTYIIL